MPRRRGRRRGRRRSYKPKVSKVLSANAEWVENKFTAGMEKQRRTIITLLVGAIIGLIGVSINLTDGNGVNLMWTAIFAALLVGCGFGAFRAMKRMNRLKKGHKKHVNPFNWI